MEHCLGANLRSSTKGTRAAIQKNKGCPLKLEREARSVEGWHLGCHPGVYHCG